MPPNHYKRYARNDFYSVTSNKENSIPLMSRATTSCIRSIYAPYSRALVRTLLSITFQHKHNVICQIFGHNCFNYLSDKMRRYQLIPGFQADSRWSGGGRRQSSRSQSERKPSGLAWPISLNYKAVFRISTISIYFVTYPFIIYIYY